MDLGINCEGMVNDESQVMASSMEVWNVTPTVQLGINIQRDSLIPFRVNLIILN
ncbi:MAG: hypothetical protein AB7F09_17825 [Parvibaculaceae bacterium]